MGNLRVDVAAVDPEMHLWGRFTVTLAAATIAAQGITAEMATREAFRIYDEVIRLEDARERERKER